MVRFVCERLYSGPFVSLCSLAGLYACMWIGPRVNWYVVCNTWSKAQAVVQAGEHDVGRGRRDKSAVGGALRWQVILKIIGQYVPVGGIHWLIIFCSFLGTDFYGEILASKFYFV